MTANNYNLLFFMKQNSYQKIPCKLGNNCCHYFQILVSVYPLSVSDVNVTKIGFYNRTYIWPCSNNLYKLQTSSLVLKLIFSILVEERLKVISSCYDITIWGIEPNWKALTPTQSQRAHTLLKFTTMKIQTIHRTLKGLIMRLI